MELFNRLPKDIQYLVNDYLKDKTNYNLVIAQFDYLIIASLNWMARPNLNSVVKFMLVQRKKEIITRNNIWYDDIKRPPTIKDNRSRYRHINRRRKRYSIKGETFFDVLLGAHKFIKKHILNDEYGIKRIM